MLNALIFRKLGPQRDPGFAGNNGLNQSLLARASSHGIFVAVEDFPQLPAE